MQIQTLINELQEVVGWLELAREAEARGEDMKAANHLENAWGVAICTINLIENKSDDLAAIAGLVEDIKHDFGMI